MLLPSQYTNDELDLMLYSDMHKDAYGFRPRGDHEWFLSLSDQERREEFDRLQEAIRERDEWEAMQEQVQKENERQERDARNWRKWMPKPVKFTMADLAHLKG